MVKITALPAIAAGDVDGTETVPIVKDGVMHRASLADLTAPPLEAAEDIVANASATLSSGMMSSLYGVLAAFNVPLASTISAVDVGGWHITNSAPADNAMAPVKVGRSGYDKAGNPAIHVDTLYRTKRVRQSYPNQASFTANVEALSEGLYATDFILNLPFNTVEVSPKAVAAWLMPSRLLVAASVHWEIVAFHKDARPWGAGGVGQQVACVQVRANNGATATAWQTVSATSLSTSVEGPSAPEVFQSDLDVSALPDGTFWLEAKVYPWFGSTASVLSSEDQANSREFSRRRFRKSATVNYVYVASTGNDTTGAVSSTAATAAATPCLTIAGALLRARTVLGSGTTGSLDGLRIRIVDGVNSGTTSIAPFTPLRQDVAGVVVERAPGTARAAAVVTMNGSLRTFFTDHTGGQTEGSLIFYDVSVVLGGAYSFTGETANKLHVVFWNCNLNYAGFVTTLRSNSHLSFYGVVVTNAPTTALGLITNTEVRMLRGVTIDLGNGGYESWVTVGSTITRAGGPSFTDPSVNGTIWYNNKFLNPASTATPIYPKGAVSGGNLGGFAIVQNLVERIDTGNSPNVRAGSDSDFGNITHAVIHHNTTSGVADAGRWNVAYDEHPTVARTHKNMSVKGNLMPSLNVKGDDYALISDGSRTGHFQFEHGIGCAGNFTKDVNALSGGASFGQAYPGIGSVIAGGDPLYVSNQSVTKPAGSLVAGAGGGDYHLQAGSPARDILAAPLLKYDLEGNPRGSGTQDAGCYA